MLPTVSSCNEEAIFSLFELDVWYLGRHVTYLVPRYPSDVPRPEKWIW